MRSDEQLRGQQAPRHGEGGQPGQGRLEDSAPAGRAAEAAKLRRCWVSQAGGMRSQAMVDRTEHRQRSHAPAASSSPQHFALTVSQGPQQRRVVHPTKQRDNSQRVNTAMAAQVQIIQSHRANRCRPAPEMGVGAKIMRAPSGGGPAVAVLCVWQDGSDSTSAKRGPRARVLRRQIYSPAPTRLMPPKTL